MKKLCLTVLLLGAPLHAEILQVPKQFPTIQSAVDAAVAGDAVHISPGTYTETLNMLGKAIQLVGIGGPEVTIIDATGLDSSVIVCSNNESAKTVISGLTMTGGTGTLHPFWKTYMGGGIFAYFASPTVLDCIVTGNTSEFAGGIWLQESQSTIENVYFEGNYVTYPVEGGAGGLYLWDSSAIVTGCTFENNSCTGAGGALRCKTSAGGNGGTSTIENCTFNSNHAESFGGAVATYRATPTFNQCSFTNNTAETYAGAMNIGGILSTDIEVAVTNCTFSNNVSGVLGGALRVNQAGAVIEKCTFSSNTTALYGGGIAVIGGESSAVCTISGSTFEDNDGGIYGGAIAHVDIASSDIDSTLFCGNQPNQITGEWNDLGGNTMNASCSFLCLGDIDASGVVNVTDILRIIADFGTCNGIDSCFSDLNDDGQVNISDLLTLIGNWGACQ